MQIAYATTFNCLDVHNWSGTPYHMAKAFENNGANLHYVGSLKRKLPPFFKLKQVWQKYLNNTRESPRFNIEVARNYSLQLASKLSNIDYDIVVSPLINPIAYLDSKKPIVLWTDAVYAALVGFYPAFAYHSSRSVQEGNITTAACLSRCSLAIFSSEWAAKSAIEFYGTSKEKVSVIPFGANIKSHPDYKEIKSCIESRPKAKIKLLFLAKSWERKGGDIALQVADALWEAGNAVELNIVGVTPKLDRERSYVNCLGFISKQTVEGKKKIVDLLTQSHFLILPSRADACPMVFAEANAHGLPSLTTYVGGISTSVKDDINGMTFALDAKIKCYCDYITDVLSDNLRYQELALSSYNEYVTRLNWDVSVQAVKKLIDNLG